MRPHWLILVSAIYFPAAAAESHLYQAKRGDNQSDIAYNFSDVEVVTATVTRFHASCPCGQADPMVTQTPSTLFTTVTYTEYDIAYSTTEICSIGGECCESLITYSLNPTTITTNVPAYETTHYHTAYETITTSVCGSNGCQQATVTQTTYATAVETTCSPIPYTRTTTAYATIVTSTCSACTAQTLTTTSLSTYTQSITPPMPLITTRTFTAYATVTTSTCSMCPQSTATVTAYTTFTASAIAATITTTTCLSNGACYATTMTVTTYTTATQTGASAVLKSSTSGSQMSSATDISSPILASMSSPMSISSVVSPSSSPPSSISSVSSLILSSSSPSPPASPYSGSSIFSSLPPSSSLSSFSSGSVSTFTLTSSPTTATSSSIVSTSSPSSPIVTTSSTSSTISFSSVAPAGATQTINVASLSYIDAMLTAHNVHRGNHSEAQLTWSANLASYAAQLAATCVYRHDTSYGGGNYGQNIGSGAAGNAAAGIINNLMYNGEVNNYPQPYGDDSPDLTNFGSWGHYSQLVWSATTMVGCATQYCPNGLSGTGAGIAPYFTVCDYSPAGNIVGQFSQVKPPQGGGTVIIISQ